MKNRIRKPDKLIGAAGFNPSTKQVEIVKNFFFIRKGIEYEDIRRYREQYGYNKKLTQHVVFVSSPYLHANKTANKLAKIWFHPFREPEKYLSCRAIPYLVSESDFVDPSFITIYDSAKKRDYFYFTLGGDSGTNYKGFSIFKNILPTIYKMGLKGLVIIYGKAFKTPKSDIRYLKNYGVTIITKKLNEKEVAKIMASSKFGLFPNIKDCSPRMITECIVRNVPVLVNYNIWGGWKYINEDTGEFLMQEDVGQSIESLLIKKYEPRKYFMMEHGLINSSKKLATILSYHYPDFKKYKLIYFSTFSNIIRKILS